MSPHALAPASRAAWFESGVAASHLNRRVALILTLCSCVLCSLTNNCGRRRLRRLAREKGEQVPLGVERTLFCICGSEQNALLLQPGRRKGWRAERAGPHVCQERARRLTAVSPRLRPRLRSHAIGVPFSSPRRPLLEFEAENVPGASRTSSGVTERLIVVRPVDLADRDRWLRTVLASLEGTT